MGTSFKGNLTLSVPETPLEMKIPVRLHPATDDPSKGGVRLKTLCPKCQTKMKWQGYGCENCGEHINHWSKGDAGYEIDDEIVPIKREEVKAVSKSRSVNVEILGFLLHENIEAERMAGKVYRASPQKEGVKYYQYLSEQLGDRWGIAKFCFGRREVLLGFTAKADDELGRNILVFHQLMFNKQMRGLPKKLKDAEWKELTNEEKEYAEMLISKFTIEPNWEELKDEYREDLEELIRKKQAGEEIEVEVPETELEEKEENELEVMKAIVEQA